MKRASLLVLLVCVGCPADHPQPKFDDVGIGPVEGGNGSGGSGLTAVSVSATSTATGAPVIPNCECIYEISKSNFNCLSCAASAMMTGLCASQHTACLNDTACTANLVNVCPGITSDTPEAVEACLTDGVSNIVLLQQYFDCLCSNPGACSVECHGSTACNPNIGLGGAGGAP